MEDIIICIGCRKRVTVEDIDDGKHSHLDEVEGEVALEEPLDPAVNED